MWCAGLMAEGDAEQHTTTQCAATDAAVWPFVTPLVGKGAELAPKGAEEQCPVCLGLLCEPVAWPGCCHHYCLVCTLRVRQRPKPTCPLCRMAAPRARTAGDLVVDPARAAQVRHSVGYTKYDVRRRAIWVAAAALDHARGSLGELPLFAMGIWHFPAGSQQRLRLLEPRYREMIRQALEPGGERRFGVVLCPAEFEVGAKGRICEIVESELGDEGDWHVVVEGGAPFQLVEVTSEEIQPGEARLYRGLLDEVDEDDLASLDESWTPLAAATEMVNILSVLGRHLRTVRRRRGPLPSSEAGNIGSLEVPEDVQRVIREVIAGEPLSLAEMARPTSSDTAAAVAPLSTAAVAVTSTPVPEEAQAPPAGESLVPGEQRAVPGPDRHDESAPTEQQDVGAMVNLLMAYREIITEMDRLLVQASHTAEQLGISDLPALPSPPTVPPPLTPAAAAATTSSNSTRRRSSSHPANDITAASHTGTLAARSSSHPGGDITASSHTDTLAARAFAGGHVATAPMTGPWEPVGGGMVLQRGERNTTLRQAPPTAFHHARNVADAAAQTAAASTSSGAEDFPCGFRSTGGLLGGWPRSWSNFMASSSQRATTASGSQRRPSASRDTRGNTGAAGMTRASTAGSHGQSLAPGSATLRATTASGTKGRSTSSSTRPSQSVASGVHRPATTTTVSNIASRSTLRQSGTRTTSSGLGPLEDRPLTQADALMLRSGSDWQRCPSAASLSNTGAGSFSMSDAPRTPSRRISPSRPRQAVFSQAARFTFPGQRSGGN